MGSVACVPHSKTDPFALSLSKGNNFRTRIKVRLSLAPLAGRGLGRGAVESYSIGVFGLSSCFNFAGGSPAASHFSCLAKKSNQKKATLPRRPFGLPCVAHAAGRLRNSRTCSISANWFGREGAVVLERPARSHSPRRLPPAALRYSAAQKGGLTSCAQRCSQIILLPTCFLE